jgi:WD40 repeat protein
MSKLSDEEEPRLLFRLTGAGEGGCLASYQPRRPEEFSCPRLLTGSQHRDEIGVWDMATGEKERSLDGHRGVKVLVAYHIPPDDRPRIACLHTDGMIRQWDPETGEDVHVVKIGDTTYFLLVYYNAAGWPRLVAAGDRWVCHAQAAGKVSGKRSRKGSNSDPFTVIGHVRSNSFTVIVTSAQTHSR